MASILYRRGWQVMRAGQRFIHVGAKCNRPVCTVETTLPRTKLPKTFTKDLSAIIAKTLGKQEALVSVGLRTEVEILRAGNEEPNAIVHIWSFGVFDKERNPAYAKEIFEYLLPAMDMTVDRVSVMFHPITREAASHLSYMDMIK